MRIIGTYTILGFAVHFSLIWLPNRYRIKTQLSKVEPYTYLLLNILHTTEYTLLSYSCNTLYQICVRWKNSGSVNFLTFTWEFLFKNRAEKPNVYIIQNECFVVMLSSCWNNTPRSNSFQIFTSNLCSSITWWYVIWQHFTTHFSESMHYFKKLVATVYTKLHNVRCKKIVIIVLITVTPSCFHTDCCYHQHHWTLNRNYIWYTATKLESMMNLTTVSS